MGLADYGIPVGAATEGFRQQEQDAMKKEAFDMSKDKFKVDMDIAKKTLAKEGFRESIGMILSGDLRGAEDYFNKIGDDRVKPGSTKFDHKTGLVTWVDKQGENQVADIRMMAAMANIKLPKQGGESNADYYRRLGYDLKAGRYSMAKQKHYDKRKKDTRNEVDKNYGGVFDEGIGQWIVPENKREAAARAKSVTDRIHDKYPGKYDPGELMRIVTKENEKITGEKIITEEDARAEATKQAKKRGGIKGIWDSSDFGGISRSDWIENKTQEIVSEAKGGESSLMKRVLSVMKKHTPKKISKSEISEAKKDPKKYAAILSQTPGWSKKQINEAIAQRFPSSDYRVK